MEAAALRLMDVDFSITPTRISVRKEFSKTKRGRTIYCSDEATKHLHKLVQMHRTKRPQDLIFAVRSDTRTTRAIYNRILEQFEKLQYIADKDQRKENSKRRKITLHSFRRTCYSVLSKNVSSDFANWFLGHNHSVYWTHTEEERREIYATVQKYLTILNYSLFETHSRNIEYKLQEKEKEIDLLRHKDALNTDAISSLSDQLSHVMQEIELLKQERS